MFVEVKGTLHENAIIKLRNTLDEPSGLGRFATDHSLHTGRFATDVCSSSALRASNNNPLNGLASLL